MKKSKKHEEFMLKDLDQLLCIMIVVNPYAAPRNLIGETWKEVVQKAQAAGYCLGRDVDTCENHVRMLLGWYEVHPTHLLFLSDTNIHAFYLGREGEEASILLTRQSEANSIGYVSLCGKIDSIAHLKHEAKELSEKQHEQAKKVSGNYSLLFMH